MSESDEHSVDAARAAADRDELGRWVASFLASPGSDNPELGRQLTDTCRWWLGPVQVPLDRLHRLAGPAGAPVLEVVDDDEWRDDVNALTASIEDGHEPPPVIASYRDDQLVLEDGNHRVEALRRAGVNVAWTVVGFTDADARDYFAARGSVAPSGPG
jgi:hypothetical protein